MENSIGGYELVAVAAKRVAQLCQEIVQAHSFGHQPGTSDEPWALAVQRTTAAMFVDATSAPYQAALAVQYERTAHSMTRLASPASAEQSWHRVCTYLMNSACAIHEHLRIAKEPSSAPIAVDGADIDLRQPTPAVVRFDQLAQIFSIEGAVALLEASQQVASACADGTPNAHLDDDERKWIALLIAGVSEVDIATEFDMSRRTLLRRLDKLWLRIGANNRIHGITICVRNGWVT